MGRNWLTAKKAKMRTAGRSKRFAKSTGPSKAALYFNDKGKPIDMSLGARGRAAQVLPDPYLDRFDLPPIEKRGPEELARLILRQNPRAVVIGRLIQGVQRGQKPAREVYKQLVDTELYKLRIYMGGGAAYFIEERINGEVRRIRKSIEYHQIGKQSGLDRALFNRSIGKITWAKVTNELVSSQT